MPYEASHHVDFFLSGAYTDSIRYRPQIETSLRGEWHHVALTVAEGANLQVPQNQLYVDGEVDSFRAGGSNNIYNLRADADVAFGNSAALLNRWYTGLMDDVRIYDRALSAGDVLWLAGGRDPIDAPFK